jgi:hypothetical protein
MAVISIINFLAIIKTSVCPRGVGQSVTECVVKPLRDIKVTGSKPARTKNPTMLRVGVAQVGYDPRVILTATG